MVPDLSLRQRVHIIAIGGAAMSAIAHILIADGHVVSGSDQADSPLFAPLRLEPVTVPLAPRNFTFTSIEQ